MSDMSENRVLSSGENCLSGALPVSFSGSRVRHELWEGRAYPDMPAVLPLNPGGEVRGSFRLTDKDFFGKLARCEFFGYPASFAGTTERCWQFYVEQVRLEVELELEINGRIVFSGSLPLISHPNCGIGQLSFLNLPAEQIPLCPGENSLVIRNLALPSDDVDGYFLIGLRLLAWDGELLPGCVPAESMTINGVEYPATSDDEAPSLLCGAGYEFLCNDDIPAMIRTVQAEGLGNYIIFRLDNALNNGSAASEDELISWARLCAERGIYFSFLAFRAPEHSFSNVVAERIKAVAGRFFFSVNLHETGLMIDGRRDWLDPFFQGTVKDLEHGRQVYLDALRRRIEDELPDVNRLVVSSVARLVAAENLANGVDFTVAELPNNGLIPLFAARGASFARGRARWGVHIATLWCLNSPPVYPLDETYVRRHELLVKYCYLAGARLIYPESGMFFQIPNYVLGRSQRNFIDNRLGPGSAVSRGIRNAYRDLNRFHHDYGLPDLPERTVAFIKGRLDPFTAVIRDGTAYRTSGLNAPDADAGWDSIEVMLPGIEVKGSTRRQRLRRWLSGSPYGQFDIVPYDIPDAQLSAYPFAFVPGWNSLDEEMYHRLETYVRNGGNLLLSAIQLRNDLKHSERPRFFASGNVESLFGVVLDGIGDDLMSCRALSGELAELDDFELCVANRLYGDLDHERPASSMRIRNIDAEIVLCEKESGLPLLVRKRLGAGVAWLLCSWDYPGHPGLLPLVKNLLPLLIKQVMPGNLRVHSSDLVSWFKYRSQERQADILAFLNTDWSEAAAPLPVKIEVDGRPDVSLEVLPGGISLVYLFDDMSTSIETVINT